MTVFVAIDGGGSKTHILAVDDGQPGLAGRQRAPVTAGVSALSIAGAEGAWQVINDGLDQVFGGARPADAELHVGIGIAGFNNGRLHAAFLAAAPGFGRLVLAGDGHSSALGAHGGAPGSVVALGTGSVGYRVMAASGAGKMAGKQVGGWGFPVDDAAGGTWLGLHAMRECMHVLDGRLGQRTALHDEVIAHCGGARQLVDWMHEISATKLATLAPMVLAAAARGDVAGERLARQAGEQAYGIARALDPAQEAPVSIIGGLADGLARFLPPGLAAWAVPAQGGSVNGAMLMARGIAGGQQPPD